MYASEIRARFLKFFERNGQAGHGTTHERARPHDAEVAVEVFDLGLAGHGGWAIGTIEQLHLRHDAARLRRTRPAT